MKLSLATLSTNDVAGARARTPRAFGPPLQERLVRGAVLFLAAAYFIFLCITFGLTPSRLWSGLGALARIFGEMLPPSSGGEWAEVSRALVETFAMAFLGTFIAALIAVPLGFLGAKTVLRNSIVHFLLRRVFDALRGVPTLIWALIFVRAVGLGPMAGVLAIVMSDIAALGKLYAEAIENADKGPIDGVKASGASGVLVLRFGLLPQVQPVMLSQALYFFESNVRAATVLGLVGAGGIGLELSERMRVYAWNEAAFVLLLVLAVVIAIDYASGFLRARLGARTTQFT